MHNTVRLSHKLATSTKRTLLHFQQLQQSIDKSVIIHIKGKVTLENLTHTHLPKVKTTFDAQKVTVDVHPTTHKPIILYYDQFTGYYYSVELVTHQTQYFFGVYL